MINEPAGSGTPSCADLEQPHRDCGVWGVGKGVKTVEAFGQSEGEGERPQPNPGTPCSQSSLWNSSTLPITLTPFLIWITPEVFSEPLVGLECWPSSSPPPVTAAS
ncbi:unnamed protein product [Rangifer tarandus platyrhynchus]|uniref:Uncharacterized protein n=1 Tax=Rangifer tarandus platyrhynchus TaxID=3082113 RepID=A0AC59YRP1_RANTA